MYCFISCTLALQTSISYEEFNKIGGKLLMGGLP
jgi:hypothetical protein